MAAVAPLPVNGDASPAVTVPAASTSNTEAIANHDNEAGNNAADGEAAEPSGPPAVETLYVNNLNEKVSLKVMKTTLKNLFKSYGVVLDVVMHRNLRMRGQAFIAMIDREAAERAVKEVRGFPLYGKPVTVSFARTPSDAVVKRKTPDLYDVHFEERKKRKGGCDRCLVLTRLCLMLCTFARYSHCKAEEPLTEEGGSCERCCQRR